MTTFIRRSTVVFRGPDWRQRQAEVRPAPTTEQDRHIGGNRCTIGSQVQQYSPPVDARTRKWRAGVGVQPDRTSRARLTIARSRFGPANAVTAAIPCNCAYVRYSALYGQTELAFHQFSSISNSPTDENFINSFRTRSSRNYYQKTDINHYRSTLQLFRSHLGISKLSRLIYLMIERNNHWKICPSWVTNSICYNIVINSLCQPQWYIIF